MKLFKIVRKYGPPALVVTGLMVSRAHAVDTDLDSGIAAVSTGASAVKVAAAAAAVTLIGYGIGLRGIKMAGLWVWGIFRSFAGR